MMKKIAIAMSGGVDSSIAAYILKNEGYDVTGVNLNLWSCFRGSKAKTCCSPEDRQDALRVCENIGIPFFSIDMREIFKEKIIIPFVKEYAEGRTPNPCILCNTEIKFDAMLKWLEKEMGIGMLATGHYARIEREKSAGHSIFHLCKGCDPPKDQSYFLFDISPETLARLNFPLGGMKKGEVRKIAREIGIDVAEKVDSQEVCFIPDGNVAAFIEDFYPEYAARGGDFVDMNGKKLGRHRGIHAYTIGQRRGLGIGFEARKYVTTIDVDKGEVTLGDDADLFGKICHLERMRILEKRGDRFAADVKIRYRSEASPAVVTLCGDDHATVEFKEPVRAITPGQAAVFYNGDMVLGGGWIERTV